MELDPSVLIIRDAMYVLGAVAFILLLFPRLLNPIKSFFKLPKSIAIKILELAIFCKTWLRRRRISSLRQQHIADHPNSELIAEKHYLRAADLYDTQRFLEAQKELLEGLAEFPYHEKSYILLGKVIYQVEKDLVKSIAEFDKAIESAPTEIEPHAEKLYHIIRYGEPDDALNHLKNESYFSAIESDPLLSLNGSEFNQLLSTVHISQALLLHNQFCEYQVRRFATTNSGITNQSDAKTESLCSDPGEISNHIKLATEAQEKITDAQRAKLVREILIKSIYSDILEAIQSKAVISSSIDSISLEHSIGEALNDIHGNAPEPNTKLLDAFLISGTAPVAEIMNTVLINTSSHPSPSSTASNHGHIYNNDLDPGFNDSGIQDSGFIGM